MIAKILLSIALWYILSFCIGLILEDSVKGGQKTAKRLVSGSILLLAILGVLSCILKLAGGTLHLLALLFISMAVVIAVAAVIMRRKEICRGFQLTIKTWRIAEWLLFGGIGLQILITILFTQNDFAVTSLLAEFTWCYQMDAMPDWSHLSITLFASWGRLLQVPPVILIQTFGGLIFLPLCYLNYAWLGETMFPESRKKRLIFLAAIWGLLVFGSGYDINFSFMKGETVFLGLLFPSMIRILWKWKDTAMRHNAGSMTILLIACAYVGKEPLIGGVLTVLVVFLVTALEVPMMKVMDKLSDQKEVPLFQDRILVESEEDDFMNSKKGKLLFWGYFILIPILLALIFCIFKLNTKINSVYEYTQEMTTALSDIKAAVAKQNEADNQNPSISGDSISGDSVSGERIVDGDANHDTIESVSTNGNLNSGRKEGYILNCFAEADGKSFVTYDTGSDKYYRIYQCDVNEDAGGLSYIIEDSAGNLTVIDGGYYGDGIHLKNFLLSHGGKVSAWYLTHPHYDHIGAFLYCRKEASEEIQIDKVYYSPFTDDFAQSTGEAEQNLEYEAFDYDEFEEIRKNTPDIEFIPMKSGDIIDENGISFTCLSAFSPSVDNVNDNSLVLKITMNGISMMITGDITEETVDRMVSEYGEDSENWNVNFLQIPHHGYTGAGERLYDLTQPEFALLDCSTTEYSTNTLGITSETVAKLHDRGIGIIKRFEGTNVILIK